jgi:hypothetical protein
MTDAQAGVTFGKKFMGTRMTGRRVSNFWGTASFLQGKFVSLSAYKMHTSVLTMNFCCTQVLNGYGGFWPNNLILHGGQKPENFVMRSCNNVHPVRRAKGHNV